MFIARVFAYSALRCHLTAQQQDKADEERGANNRRRSQRREILQQGALLSCCLAHRRIPPTLRRGAPPCMCLTQVLEIFVLLSNASVPAACRKAAMPALAFSGPVRGRTAARGGHRTEAAPGHHGVTGRPCREPAGSGRNQPSPSIVSHRRDPPRGWPCPGRDSIRDGPARRRSHGRAFAGQSATGQMIGGRCGRAPRRPGLEPAQDLRHDGRACRARAGRIFRLMNGPGVAGSDRPPPVAVRREGHRYGNVPRRPPHPLEVFTRVQQGLRHPASSCRSAAQGHQRGRYRRLHPSRMGRRTERQSCSRRSGLAAAAARSRKGRSPARARRV